MALFALNRSRADSLALKAQLSDLLPPEEGAEYWRSWGDMLTGKVTRDEFAASTKHILVGEAARLHNLLILAILYNTTRASVAPPATSRHAGWSKRRREGDDEASQLALSLDPREAKKRRVKELVHSLGKRERRRIKNVAVLGQPTYRGEMLQRSFGLIDGVTAHATIANKGLSTELKRCQAAEICSETLALPSGDVIKDRMSCGSFAAALSGGVDPSAAVLLGTALEVHLKKVIQAALEVMRSRKRLDPAPPLPADPVIADEPKRFALPKGNHISMLDMATLYELDPQLLVGPHIGAMETHLSAHDWSVPKSEFEEDDFAPPEGNRSADAAQSNKKLKDLGNHKMANSAPVVQLKMPSPPKKGSLANGVAERPPLTDQPTSQKASPTFRPNIRNLAV